MQHKFICFKRFKGKGIEGEFNITYGTECLTDDKFIYYNGDCNTGKTICSISSDTSFNHFAINDDGKGLERGNLSSSIVSILSDKSNKDRYDKRWEKVWEDDLSNTMRRKDYPEYWLWDIPFYQASILDLNHILQIIKEVK